MSITRAFAAGLGRLRRAPGLVVGLWLSTVLVALPLSLTLRAGIARHLGSSLAAEAAATGVNHDWWNEFLAQATGLSQTFVPAILGFAAVLRNLSSVADAAGIPMVLVGVVAAYVVISVFLMGGALDRLARDRRVGTYAFFAACGTYFPRLLRLSLIGGAIYWALFTSFHSWLFDSIFTSLTHDVTAERIAIAYRGLLYLVFAAAVVGVNVLFDYAKVRMVVEDRRSAIGALTSSLRFIARNPGVVFGLYLLDVLIFVAVLALYALAVPGAAGGITAWAALLIGQLYIALRVAVRLLFAACELSLFQGRLSHARYTAAPVATWPDSPAAEAVSPP